MKKWRVLFAVLMLAGCSAGTNEKTYYQLPHPPLITSSIEGKSGLHYLWIEHVSVPDFLAGSGVVYQTTDVQYVMARSHLWASPLDQQLRDTLVSHLSNALPGWVIASQPLENDQDVLTVNVTGFNGRYDGKVIVSGEWLLKHQGKVIRQPFQWILPQHADGYDALIKTLSQGWTQESQQIAAYLSKLN